MAADRDQRPVYASTLLWGFVLLATAAVIVTRGLVAGAAVFASAAVCVLVLTLVLAVLGRLEREPQYENKLDPWDD